MRRIIQRVKQGHEGVDLPYRLVARVLVDGLVLSGIIGLGVLAKAWAQGTMPPASEFPWAAVIQGVVTVLTAVLAWLVKSQVTQLHTTINSKMDALLKLTADAERAKGVLEGQAKGVLEGEAKAVLAHQARSEKPR